MWLLRRKQKEEEKKNFKKREKKKEKNFLYWASEKEVTKRICLDSASEEATKNEFPSLGC